MASPYDQSRYQVRFERGVEGLARLAPADIVVLVDVLGFSTELTDAVATPVVTDAAARGASAASTGSVHSVPAGAGVLAAEAEASGAVVLLGCVRNATAVARAIAAEQARRQARTSVAIIAVGETASAGSPRPSVRSTVEDDLGAGAVIDALGALGIDHTSPEAAVVGEGFRGLRRALVHLLTASGSGQELIAAGRADEVRVAAELDAVAVVPMLRDGSFTALG
jgi:2-phosphosulfolactate phosphatase